jgi:hypothetical protein
MLDLRSEAPTRLHTQMERGSGFIFAGSRPPRSDHDVSRLGLCPQNASDAKRSTAQAPVVSLQAARRGDGHIPRRRTLRPPLRPALPPPNSLLTVTPLPDQRSNRMTSRTTIQHIITSLPLDIATAELASVIDTLTYEVAAHRLQSNTGSEASGPHPQSGLSVDKPDAPDVGRDHPHPTRLAQRRRSTLADDRTTRCLGACTSKEHTKSLRKSRSKSCRRGRDRCVELEIETSCEPKVGIALRGWTVGKRADVAQSGMTTYDTVDTVLGFLPADLAATASPD